ncbi:hypothetical protein GCM10011515_14570 [Tsuneonella deserti]|uniref:Dicarboxylate transport n=1 Tax=Tsuneonella deserti TaxID=2035528 RepID=A0ABQ1S9V1_9SPHN|nr:YdbH domain-containing protein [Tsuneonella deserti]GGD95761.1 hypothetical protein GCM10011515_14570 [Tsuneonella deserti]
MAEADSEVDEAAFASEPARRRWWLRVLLVTLLVLLVAVAGIWFSRERIAENIIERQLRQYDIPATYKISRIGPDRQVLTNIVVGDPRAPDLTVERAEVPIVYRLGTPTIGRITLIRPRLYGSFRSGQLSFGSLDKALFRKTGKPPGLPRLDLHLVDGRALVKTDFGPVGLKADGAGKLDSGFSGILAVASPKLDGGGCSARATTLFGRVSSKDGKATIKGPLRLGRLSCGNRGFAVEKAALALDTTVDADFKGLEGGGRLETARFAAGGIRANGLAGTLRANWRAGKLNGRYSLAARGLSHPQLRAALVTAEGTVRARDGLATSELQAEVVGNGLRVGAGLDAALADAGRSVEGTLLGPLLQQARGALAREGRASSLAARFTARRTRSGTSLVVPQASLRGGSGATLLALSRGQLSLPRTGAVRFSGNFATGGAGLPRIVGRMEQGPAGKAVLRLRMAQYRAGSSSLEIPELVVAQNPNGALGFAGRARASGVLPGGSARNLALPLDGNWSPGGALALWRRCTKIGFDRLELASLSLDRRSLTLCPSAGQPILRRDGRGLRIAAGAPSLNLSGRLADTAIRLKTGPVGFAYPGALSARAVDVSLGPAATASSFRIANLTATFGREIGGRFADADVRLYGVPLDLLNASGNWRYAGGALSLGDGEFRLVDRNQAARFSPLVSSGATLTLRDNLIRALATLREPGTGREVVEAAILHDLGSGVGHADLAVKGVLFDRRLQPFQLLPAAKGVVANVSGTVRGTGRIAWNASGVKSTGSFSSDALDFAASFGPVRGASGTVEFTDLLGLTTAPGQRIRVGSVNPGIEVTDGEFAFSLRDGQILGVEGARWPFMGGTLTLRSTTLNLGVSEERRYIFEIEGLQAGQFVEQMDLSNINATGTFDGTLPIVFDSSGNGRIEGGLLIARSPGGNISYLGELTRRDLGTMANFAFEALRSLDYQQMSVGMDGSLTGEIVTKVRFDGVKQGARAKRNFITRRFENLPLRFNINIRAPFYQLITSIKAMYDPASVRDPRDVGLLNADGSVLQREVTAPPPAIKPEDIIPDVPPVQTSESEKMP